MWQRREPSSTHPGNFWCGVYRAVFRLRVLQQFTSSRRLDRVRNLLPDPTPASRPWRKGHPSKQPGPDPAQAAKRRSGEATTWSSDEVHTLGKKKTLHGAQAREAPGDRSVLAWCSTGKAKQPQTSKRWAHQAWPLTGSIKELVYKSSAKRWKTYTTYQGCNLSFLRHFSV